MITVIAADALHAATGGHLERVPALAAQLGAAIMRHLLDHGWSAISQSVLVAPVGGRGDRMIGHRPPCSGPERKATPS